MSVLYVNDRPVPTPSSLTVTLFDVAGAGERNALGETVIDRVATKRRLELAWSHLSPEALAGLLAATGETFFTAAYPDPLTGAAREMTCFVEDRSAAVLRVEDGAPVWHDLKMCWTER